MLSITTDINADNIHNRRGPVIRIVPLYSYDFFCSGLLLSGSRQKKLRGTDFYLWYLSVSKKKKKKRPRGSVVILEFCHFDNIKQKLIHCLSGLGIV